MDPRSAYRESAIRGASGVGLVIVLYEQVIQDLREAVIAMDKGDVELRTKSINHAFSVIAHLQGTLDRERGGAVAPNLDRFYCRLRGRLTEAHVRMSKEILHEQISDLLSLREAWRQVNQTTSATQSGVSTGDKQASCSVPAPSRGWKY